MGQASVPLMHRGLQALKLESLEVLKGYLWSRAASCCENRVCVCQHLLKKKKKRNQKHETKVKNQEISYNTRLLGFAVTAL